MSASFSGSLNSIYLYVQFNTGSPTVTAFSSLGYLAFTAPTFSGVTGSEVSLGFHRTSSPDAWDLEAVFNSSLAAKYFLFALPVNVPYEVHYGSVGGAKNHLLCVGSTVSFEITSVTQHLTIASVENCVPPATAVATDPSRSLSLPFSASRFHPTEYAMQLSIAFTGSVARHWASGKHSPALDLCRWPPHRSSRKLSR
jgi:hypothetical protein